MEKNWHALDKTFVLNNLDSNYNGLSTKEANERLKKYGRNELPKKKNDGFIKLVLKGMLDPIIIVLIITVIFSFIINEKVDAYTILFIMVIDLIIGAIQEWSATKTADSLSKLIRVNTRVIRDDKEIDVLIKQKGTRLGVRPDDHVIADLDYVLGRRVKITINDNDT